MKRKIITLVIIAALIVIGIRACYLSDYETVLKYPKESSTLYISSDSIPVVLSFFVENSRTLGAVVNFETLKDSLFIEQLEVTVYGTDKPKQPLRLSHVSTPVHPPTGIDGHLDKLEANSFNDLPLNYKTIRNSGLPYNFILFYFKKWFVNSADFYTFKISGKIIYKGQTFLLEKEIKTERKVEYHPYRMMT